jgi:hypothetical protein
MLPLARDPASVETRAPPRASFRLTRGVHRPAASIPAPPAGAFNALIFAGAKSKANPHHYAPGNHALALLRQLPGRGHPCHCATLCGVVGNRPAALYHPLPYGRRTTPSKKDGGTLEGMTHDYSAPARDGTVTSGQWERSPPSPSALCDHPGHCTTIPDAVGACGDGTPPRQPLCLVRPHVNGTLESSRGQPSNEQPLHHPPRSRSWTRTGHAMTPRQKRYSPGQPSTLWHCTPCLYT